MTTPSRSLTRSVLARPALVGVAALVSFAVLPVGVSLADTGATAKSANAHAVSSARLALGTPRAKPAGVRARPAATGDVVQIGPGDSLAAALKSATSGTTVVLSNGTYALQKLTFMSLYGVTLRGESRDGVTVKGFTFKGITGLDIQTMTITNEITSGQSAIRVSDGSADLTFDDLTIAPTLQSGLDVWAGVKRITLTGSTLIGTGVTGSRATDSTSRGVRINGAPYDMASWPTNISVIGNDISGFGSDLIQIVGGQHVLVKNNVLHDPQFTDDHNDGVQSAGSDDLRIEGNRFSAPGPNGPDQAVMIGQHPSIASLKVTNTVVVNNLVTTWRGTGINLAGTANTTILNNTVASTGQGVGSSVGLHATNTNVKIYNNILDKVLLDSGQTPVQWDNCVRFGGSGSGLITLSPKFANTTTYQLQATSPCRAAADPSGAPTTDIAGTTRGTAPDRGAWQY